MKYIFYERDWQTALTQEVATAVVQDGQVDWFGSAKDIAALKELNEALRMEPGVSFGPTDEEH